MLALNSNFPLIVAMTKYRALGEHLRSLDVDCDTLSLAQIERIIGSPLPKSARVHASWWGNDKTHSHARVWMEAGWRARPSPSRIDPIVFERVVVDVFRRPADEAKGKAQVIVRNLDPAVVARLKAQAKRARRSLEQELRLILAGAARPKRAELLVEADRIRSMTSRELPDSTRILREYRDRE